MTRMFNYSAAGLCGVFVPEHVMKKIAKINSKYQSEVRRVLEDNCSDLIASHWTLTYPEGKQCVMHYGIIGEEATPRIQLFDTARPQYLAEIKMFNSHEEARASCTPEI